jgi:hypothetical protein
MKQEGNAIGLNNDEVDDVFAGVLMVWKGGNVTGYNSSGGWVRLPYKTLNGVEFREFAVSAFIHDWSNAADPSVSGTILPEILRDEIAEMMVTWL